MEHQYGYDMEKDIKKLYGKEHESINNRRMELWEMMCEYDNQLRQLKSIIQNPVPITREDLTEWKHIKNRLEVDGTFSKKMKDVINEVEEFVKEYHLTK